MPPWKVRRRQVTDSLASGAYDVLAGCGYPVSTALELYYQSQLDQPAKRNLAHASIAQKIVFIEGAIGMQGRPERWFGRAGVSLKGSRLCKLRPSAAGRDVW
jgi:hypothetical protein